MTRQMEFKSRFTDYLQSKMTPQKQQQLFPTLFKEYMSSPSTENSNHSFRSSLFDEDDFLSSPEQQSCCSASQPVQESYSKSTPNRNSTLKRLKKVTDIGQVTCAICLEEIRRPSTLQCKHTFCEECLKGWVANSSRCPYCRQQCHQYTCSGRKYPIQPKQLENQQSQSDQVDWVCYVCDHTQQGDVVLICECCDAAACHIDCDLQLSGVEPPEHVQWFCHTCRGDPIPRRTTRQQRQNR